MEPQTEAMANLREGFLEQQVGAVARGERKEAAPYKKLLLAISDITRAAVRWLHEAVLKTYKPDQATYTTCLYKALFMARSHEEYYQLDGWPLEADRWVSHLKVFSIPLSTVPHKWVTIIGRQKVAVLIWN